jgi:AraC-like DNA-binding protein
MGAMVHDPLARHLLRARDLMDVRYAQPLDVPTLARRANVSASYFARQFRATFGETPHRYLLTRRIERAQWMLRETDRSVTEICFDVGLTSVGSFCTSFRRIVGMTPGAYRELAREPMPAIPSCVLRNLTRPVVPGSFREDRAGGRV